MKNIVLAAAFTLAAFPVFAQNSVVVPGQSGFETTSPEVGVKGAAAADARAMGAGTPQVAPNGSAYVPSNRGVDPASGYRADTTGSVAPTRVPVEVSPNGSTYVPVTR